MAASLNTSKAFVSAKGQLSVDQICSEAYQIKVSCQPREIEIAIRSA